MLEFAIWQELVFSFVRGDMIPPSTDVRKRINYLSVELRVRLDVEFCRNIVDEIRALAQPRVQLSQIRLTL
jgi:hypothetical protein